MLENMFIAHVRMHAPSLCDDQDAILGMLLLVLATKTEQPAWWDEVARWTYQSCRAFLEHNTEPHASKVASNGQPQRMLKLGSCWGGWDCSNPSYHALATTAPSGTHATLALSKGPLTKCTR